MANRINFRVHLPDCLNRIYPEAIWQMPSGEKTVYLTFDDGPVPEVTGAVLEILKKHNIKATFFCVGDNVVKYPEIYKRIIDEGHITGNHTYNHLNGLKNNNKTYLSNIEKASDVIDSPLFRPPYGLLKKSQYEVLKNHYRIIMWDVISCDYDPRISPEQCYRNVLDFVRDGSIITFHDSYKASKNVLNALPNIINRLINEGYSFKKLDFLFPIPETGASWKKRVKRLNYTNNKSRKRA